MRLVVRALLWRTARGLLPRRASSEALTFAASGDKAVNARDAPSLGRLEAAPLRTTAIALAVATRAALGTLALRTAIRPTFAARATAFARLANGARGNFRPY